MRRLFSLMILLNSLISADILVNSEARKSFSIAIYNNFGVVQDIRTVNLPKGNNRLRFDNVASTTQASSAFLQWNGDGNLEILGQSYEYDLLSPIKLLEKYIGKELEIVPLKESWPDTVPQRAELISINGDEPVFRIGTKITFGQIGQILFPYMPENLYTRPTLIWDINSPQRQDIELIATYLADGISWNAGYTLHVDSKDNTCRLTSSITIKNNSGMDCNNANITLVAGNVDRVSAENNRLLDNKNKGGDIYLYNINRPITVKDKKLQIIEWIPAVNVKFKQDYRLLFKLNSEIENNNSDVMAVIENKDANSLGIPLPEGCVRVFKKDAQSRSWFVGEGHITDTKVDDIFKVKINSTNEIYGVKKQINKSTKEFAYTIEIRNLKDKAIDISVSDIIKNLKVVSSSEKYTIVQDSICTWDIKMSPKSSKTINYTMQN